MTVSASIQDFSRSDRRAITVEDIEYSMDGAMQRYIRFIYRSIGSDATQGWYFNLSVVLP